MYPRYSVSGQTPKRRGFFILEGAAQAGTAKNWGQPGAGALRPGLSLGKAHTWAAAIFSDEFNA